MRDTSKQLMEYRVRSTKGKRVLMHVTFMDNPEPLTSGDFWESSKKPNCNMIYTAYFYRCGVLGGGGGV